VQLIPKKSHYTSQAVVEGGAAVKIRIDDQPVEVPDGATVADVLEDLGEAVGHLLVELNGVYVYPEDHGRRRLHPGDRLEIIYPAFGG